MSEKTFSKGTLEQKRLMRNRSVISPTSIPFRDGWCYLASVIDLHTKKIVGYSFSRTMTTELITKALENAYHTQKPADGLIFHSNLGTQYTSDEFKQVIDRFNMTHSFSYKGSPNDNACIESFHAILKKEEVNHVRYLDFGLGQLALFQYIEDWYNRQRIHGSIDYRTPQDMEDLALSIA